MKQPTPLWQVVSICVTVLIASFTGIIAQSNKIARLDEKVSRATDQYNTLSRKMDELSLDIRQVLVTLQNKQDRP